MNRWLKYIPFRRMAAVRQAVLLTCVFLALLLAAGFAAIDQIDETLEEQFEAELAQRFAQISTDMRANGFDRAAYPFTGTERVILLAKEPFIDAGFHNNIRIPNEFREGRNLGRGRWIYLAGETPEGQLIVGTNVGRRDQFFEILGETVIFVGISAAAIALAFGIFSGFRTQRRLNKISATLTKVGQGELDARTGTSRAKDDLDDLSIKLDETIAQLEALMRQTREFSASIAHDLKTPLARLRLRLETALTAEIEDGDSVEQIGAALEQTDEVIGIFDAVLRIARLESGNAKAKFETIDLTDLTQEFSEIYGAYVEDSGRRFVIDNTTAQSVTGDRVLLIQMLANLVENAVRYTPEGSTIELIAKGRTLLVCDDGPGIPDTEYSNVIRPLYRLDKSRTSEGVGLGLALSKAIANLHGVDLEFGENPKSEARGLCVSLDMSK